MKCLPLCCVLTFLSALSAVPTAAPARDDARITASTALPITRETALENALVISVDGLRSDALIALSADDLPNFQRLRRGASTLNARTDPDWTVTLPNHTAMMTGRFVEGPSGHHWTKNDDHDPDETLHTNRGAYVPGIFDVAHDHGFDTALYSGKSKFSIYADSWSAASGAPDTTDADDGQKKIDRFVFDADLKSMTSALLADLARETTKHRLFFVHFAITDLAGHTYGWDVSSTSKYMKAVAAVDAQLGRVLDAIAASPALNAKTAVLLTADHGGGAPWKSHDQAHMWIDYIIPFIVWTGTNGEPRDLYALNADTRLDPGLGRPRRGGTGLPPIRNGDAANLVLTLLGLPPLAEAEIDAHCDLRVFSTAHATR